MKKRTAVLLVGCVGLAALAVSTHLATAGIEDPPVCGNFASEVDSVPATAAMGGGFVFSIGFEPGEAYIPGYISNAGGTPVGCGGVANPCWGHTASNTCPSGAPGPVCTISLVTPTIEDANPATGVQHLRLTHDPTTRTNIPYFGLGVDARFPRTADLTARPVAATTVSVDLAISGPGGQNFRLQPQSNSQGCMQGSALFYEDGEIYIMDDLCGADSISFVPSGFQWDTTGGYQNFTWVNNPCTDTIQYFYGGQMIYSGCIVFGSNLEQFLVFGDNYPGSHMDVDNVFMASDDECPHACGNGVLESWAEQCEPGVVECRPGHTCGAPGTPGECTCDRICTLDNPCVLNNGANTFYPPFDAQYGGIFIYEAPDGVDAVSIETCGTTGADTWIRFWGSCTDPADPGSSNDDCCDPASPQCGAGYGAGSDPSAGCYSPGALASPWPSCTCHDNPLPGDNCYVAQITGGTNSNTAVYQIEVNKKAACGEGHLGSCCDTNGADQGCTDNVLSGDCVGADKVWTENGKCVDQVCECIPDCAGAECGDDGCGGTCGSCGDGNVCNGEETCVDRNCVADTPLNCNDGNFCNGFETCDPSSGCVPGTPLNCNDGEFCNGIETCNPSSGCVPGAAPNCDDGQECSVDTCNEETDACESDDSGCAIPTMSQWGLVILTMLLLVAAKVQFGRRRTSSP